MPWSSFQRQEREWIIQAGGVCRAELDLEVEVGTMSARVCEGHKACYLPCAVKRRTGASSVGGFEAVLREGGKIAQGSLSLRVLLSVSTMAVMTFEFPNLSTLMLGPRS